VLGIGGASFASVGAAFFGSLALGVGIGTVIAKNLKASDHASDY
jgi:hypothetical protein